MLPNQLYKALGQAALLSNNNQHNYTAVAVRPIDLYFAICYRWQLDLPA